MKSNRSEGGFWTYFLGNKGYCLVFGFFMKLFIFTPPLPSSRFLLIWLKHCCLNILDTPWRHLWTAPNNHFTQAILLTLPHKNRVAKYVFFVTFVTTYFLILAWLCAYNGVFTTNPLIIVTIFFVSDVFKWKKWMFLF